MNLIIDINAIIKNKMTDFSVLKFLILNKKNIYIENMVFNEFKIFDNDLTYQLNPIYNLEKFKKVIIINDDCSNIESVVDEFKNFFSYDKKIEIYLKEEKIKIDYPVFFSDGKLDLFKNIDTSGKSITYTTCEIAGCYYINNSYLYHYLKIETQYKTNLFEILNSYLKNKIKWNILHSIKNNTEILYKKKYKEDETYNIFYQKYILYSLKDLSRKKRKN